jgi:hypothetical protein
MEKDAIYCIFGSQNYVMAGETPHKSYSFKRFLDPLFRVLLRFTRGIPGVAHSSMGGRGAAGQISDISRRKR